MTADVNDGPGAGEAARWDDDGLSDQYTDLPTLAMQRAVGAANGLVAFVQAQPVLAAAVIASLIGAVIGVSLARRPRPSRRERLVESIEKRVESASEGARRAGKRSQRTATAFDYGELVGLAMRLLENPLVRAYAIRLATRNLAKRFK